MPRSPICRLLADGAGRRYRHSGSRMIGQIGNKVQINLRHRPPALGARASCRPGDYRKPTRRDAQDHTVGRCKARRSKTTILGRLASPINAATKRCSYSRLLRTRQHILTSVSLRSFWKTEHLHTGEAYGADSPKSTLKKSSDFRCVAYALFSAIKGESSRSAWRAERD